MEIRVRATGAVMFENEWRRYIHEQSGLNFGQLDEATLNQYGADVVFEGPQATGGTVYQYSMRQGVEQQSDGKWYTKYVLGPIFTDTAEATAAEQEAAYKSMKDAEQAKAAREDRTRRLSATDWTQLADAPVDKTAWATYRQALRDVPAQAGFPWNVQWPDTP
jgi:hypothetical protein